MSKNIPESKLSRFVPLSVLRNTVMVTKSKAMRKTTIPSTPKKLHKKCITVFYLPKFSNSFAPGTYSAADVSL